MKFLSISCLAILLLSASYAFGLDFYQGTVSSKLRSDGHSYQKDAQVSYAREGNRFVIVVLIGERSSGFSEFGDDFYFEFYGEIEENGDQVKLYELPYEGERYDGGAGQCLLDSNDCELKFKWGIDEWGIGDRSSARGKIVTKFSDNTMELTFGITGYWFPDGRKKVDFTKKLQRSASASEGCNMPSPDVDLYAWIKHCSSL